MDASYDDDDDDLQSTISEQRREFEAAKAVESDLDLAFQLQMQEAMNASLSLSSQPSPSSSTQPLQNLEDDVVPGPGFAHLVAEEFAKFEREREDRKHVELEMNSLRDDLNRRIHDRVFARDLIAVPEDEWEENGDYFEKPYRGGDQSVTATAGTMRLYFKGMVSDQTVRGVRKTLAGVGIAICDVDNNPIMELRKPLVGDDGAIAEVVEIKALIEGLNAALTLDLKRLTVFCHVNSLYRYVTGKWQPRSGKIANLVDQVTLLQRKFTYCNQAFVKQRDIRFAFNLAWDAIISQVTRPAENSASKNLIENCAICLEDRDVSEIFIIDNCLHRYCFSCMKQHTEMKLLQGALPKCPHEGCNSMLKLGSCKRFLSSELFDIMSQRIKEASIPNNEKIYCPNPRCSALMSKNEVLGNTSNASAGGGRAVAVKCLKCDSYFCMNCKVPWHSNMTCDAYKRLNPHPSAEDAKLKSLATRKLWRQCVKCNHMVELAEGCYHINCRCGYEFCYSCGAEWKNKKATCSCPIWDEPNILYNEHGRPRQRRRLQ